MSLYGDLHVDKILNSADDDEPGSRNVYIRLGTFEERMIIVNFYQAPDMQKGDWFWALEVDASDRVENNCSFESFEYALLDCLRFLAVNYAILYNRCEQSEPE